MRWVSGLIGLLVFVLFGGAPAHAQQAGTLISAQPVPSQAAASKAWRITYWTRDDMDRPEQATGLVISPDASPAAGRRDVLAWTHGTWGISDACSPSASPNFWKQTPALQALQRGMTVVAPDYIGLGGGGETHPFLVGTATARAVLDAVRAAQAIDGAAAGRRFAVWGESQGGHAALWTAQVQPGYAPELELVGAAASAPPTSLPDNLRQAPNAGARTFFTALIAASWSDHFDIPLDSIAGPVSRAIITRLAATCLSLDTKPTLMTVAGIATLQSNLRDVDLTVTPPWGQLAVSNSPQRGGFAVPLLIGQNPGDQLVAPAVTRTYARALCTARERVRWIDIQGSGHATSALDSAGPTLDWIADRFAGKAAPSDCATI